MNKNCSILYVDDEPMNRLLFESLFKKKYTVYTASSGSEGLGFLKTNQNVRIVFSDMKMPNMTGVEFIKQAKKDFTEIDFYIVSGYDISIEIQNAIKDGLIKKYFNKPMNIQEIEKSINEAIEKNCCN